MRIQFQDLYDELIADEARNQLICDEVRAGRSRRPVAPGLDRTQRASRSTWLSGCRTPSSTWSCCAAAWRRRRSGTITARLAAIPEDEPRVLLATGRYIGEGFDDARLDTLFLTLPVSWRGTIAQYVGRLHRLHHRKREVRVYDYADLNVPMLARMFDRRCRGYEAVGYTICSRPAPCRAGPPTFRCPSIRSGRATTRPVCGGSFATASTAAGESVRPRHSRGRARRAKASAGRAVRPRRFSTAAWRRCRKPRAGSA